MQYRLPRANDSRLPLPRRKGYQLLKAEVLTPVVQPRAPFRADHVAPGDARHGVHVAAQRTPTTRQRFQIDAPKRDLPSLGTLFLQVAGLRGNA